MSSGLTPLGAPSPPYTLIVPTTTLYPHSTQTLIDREMPPRTCDSAMNLRPIFQLHGNRFMAQFHQKPKRNRKLISTNSRQEDRAPAPRTAISRALFPPDSIHCHPPSLQSYLTNFMAARKLRNPTALRKKSAEKFPCDSPLNLSPKIRFTKNDK